jgi:hypothetical protein
MIAGCWIWSVHLRPIQHFAVRADHITTTSSAQGVVVRKLCQPSEIMTGTRCNPTIFFHPAQPSSERVIISTEGTFTREHDFGY